jgi:mRNA interferase RelE/StbE
MQRRVLRALAALETNPRPPQSRKLAGHENLWRLRVGDWRIIYTIEDERLIVIIVGVGHRGDVYRRM